MTALATIAIATAAIAGGEIAAAAGGGSTALVGESCAFGINGMSTFAIAAGVESAEAETSVFTTNSRRRIGRNTLRTPTVRIGRSRI